MSNLDDILEPAVDGRGEEYEQFKQAIKDLILEIGDECDANYNKLRRIVSEL
jgi:hypothetical protein